MNVDINKLTLKYVEDSSKGYKKVLGENQKKQAAGKKRKNEKKMFG